MIRRATNADVALCYATWIRCMRESRLEYKSDVTFCARLHDEIERILETPGTEVVVACADDDPDCAWGWACGCREPQVLHFVYVKGQLHRAGVGRALVCALIDPTQPFAATYVTPVARAVAQHCRLPVTFPKQQSKRKVA